MTMITGNQTHDRARVDSGFDALVQPAEANDRPAQAAAPRTLEELMLAEPSRPSASLKTVAMVFLAIAVAQVGVLALSVSSFDLSAFRLVLAYVVVAPAVLYTIVAAWDHRQLVASGHDAAPRWEWAFVFPPIYLALRFARVHDSRDMGAALGWGIAQLAVTIAFLVFAATALVTAPVQSAEAVPASAAGAQVTASVVEQQVMQGWADAGDTGTATCAEPASQDPGTPISCTGVFAGAPIEFTAVVGDQAAGDAPAIITRWSQGTAG